MLGTTVLIANSIVPVMGGSPVSFDIWIALSGLSWYTLIWLLCGVHSYYLLVSLIRGIKHV